MGVIFCAVPSRLTGTLRISLAKCKITAFLCKEGGVVHVEGDGDTVRPVLRYELPVASLLHLLSPHLSLHYLA